LASSILHGDYGIGFYYTATNVFLLIMKENVLRKCIKIIPVLQPPGPC
jgi:hypothetical protein